MTYELPDFLKDKEICGRHRYMRWLERRAATDARRNKKKSKARMAADYKRYKRLIHKAVKRSGGRDYYTGSELDWSLISKFDNNKAKKGGGTYLNEFWRLPTVDHAKDEAGKLHFVICSWRVNDAKGEMSEAEFYELCKQVLEHREKRR